MRRLSHYYINYNSFIYVFVICFLLCLVLYKIFIPILYRFKIGQTIREDGPETHLKKQGTATMGGIIFSLVIIVVSSVSIITMFSKSLYTFHYNSLYLLFSMFLFAVIGFIDDYLKIKVKNTKGLMPRFKFLLQVCSGLLFIYCIFFNGLNINILPARLILRFTNTTINFTGIGIVLFVFILMFIILGTNNGVNFTDGLDGLCSSVTIIVAILYFIVSIKMKEYELAIINISVIASLLGFLVYNHFPAKIFMGDTGSLFLGAYVALMAILLDIELLIPIFGFVYLIEIVSVIMQVSYFKWTHGKRIFLMTPIHHHFEKMGMKEYKIVLMFDFITLVLSIVSYFIIFGGING